MSSYRTRRTKLKRHDQGHDRHNKGVCWLRKKARTGAAWRRDREQFYLRRKGDHSECHDD